MAKGEFLVVWLKQVDNKVPLCIIVVSGNQNEEEFDHGALSMRGAQRLITGEIIRRGFTPIERWQIETAATGMGITELTRKFRKVSNG